MNEVSDHYKNILEKLPAQFTEAEVAEQLAIFAGADSDDPLFLGGAADLFRASIQNGIIGPVGSDAATLPEETTGDETPLYELKKSL